MIIPNLNADIKADLTDSVSQVTKEIINDKRTIVNTIKFPLSFLSSKIKPILYKSIQECEYKLKKIDAELKEKYESIPEENRIEPRMSIVCSSLEGLKYNLDEIYIKKMFVNILGNEMDDRKQERIVPAYIEIIKQLSKNDAIFILNYSKIFNLIVEMYILHLTNENKYYLLYKTSDNNIYCDQINIISLENLKRLAIINYNEKIEYVINDEFKEYFEILNKLSNNNLNNCSIMAINFTHLGNELTELCCL